MPLTIAGMVDQPFEGRRRLPDVDDLPDRAFRLEGTVHHRPRTTVGETVRPGGDDAVQFVRQLIQLSVVQQPAGVQEPVALKGADLLGSEPRVGGRPRVGFRHCHLGARSLRPREPRVQEVRGRTPEQCLEARRELSAPIVEALRACPTPRNWQGTSNMRSGAGNGLTRFLRVGRVEMDTNPVENAIRPIPLTRKNALFAGSDDGARTGPVAPLCSAHASSTT